MLSDDLVTPRGARKTHGRRKFELRATAQNRRNSPSFRSTSLHLAMPAPAYRDRETSVHPTPDRAVMHRLDELEVNQKFIMESLEEIINTALFNYSHVKELRERRKVYSHDITLPCFAPASNLDELDVLLTTDHIVERLRCEEYDAVGVTLKAMIKTLMTRSLLNQFSFNDAARDDLKSKVALKTTLSVTSYSPHWS
ncbi:uncharacterized protein LOC108673219 [Hyalella azteca]|uniref:Uncharacterized protein LOC108673219 n=1 Tax=Hyalella azteca TaxID=294128 RepID=A0A8B7NS09_HYAAZ|nr:uncharacterized protein LOC108673219 [Hyalella azteca]XP_018016503.1 uncharacterized protein LOC108673219 [Hyalella azteca]XP_047735702.1 uncharacterized protein LOC108673219 [Hyalella azteca]